MKIFAVFIVVVLAVFGCQLMSTSHKTALSFSLSYPQTGKTLGVKGTVGAKSLSDNSLYIMVKLTDSSGTISSISKTLSLTSPALFDFPEVALGKATISADVFTDSSSSTEIFSGATALEVSLETSVVNLNLLPG